MSLLESGDVSPVDRGDVSPWYPNDAPQPGGGDAPPAAAGDTSALQARDSYGNDDYDPTPEADDPCDFDWDSDTDYNVPETDVGRFR